jgi:hypothetical protein
MDGMGWVWSRYFEMNILSSLAWEEVCGHMLRSIFFVLAGIGLFWKTHVEILFVTSLACDCFVHNLLMCILFSLALVGFCQHMNIVYTLAW